MESYQVEVLNPKATKLLQDLADLKLITIKKTNENDFLKTVNRLRKKSALKPISIEEITKEVEIVRAARYERSKK